MKLLNIYIELGFDINIQAYNECTLLMITCFINDLKRIKLFVDLGCELNLLDNDGKSALTWSIIKGHEEVVEFLIKAGCDIEMVEMLIKGKVINLLIC